MDPFAQDVIDGARDAHDPTQDDRARVRAKIAARIGAGAGVAGASAVAKASVGASTLAKIIVPVVALVAIGGYAIVRMSEAPRAPAVAAAVATFAPTASVEAPVATIAPTQRPEVVAPAPSESTTAIATATAHPKPLVLPTSGDLEAETIALAEAQSAIQRGDYASALSKLDAEDRAYPRGTLAEERIAVRALALCGAGRNAEGQTLGKAFLAKHPRSPLAPRVRSACAVP